jgi:CubicO group peptidase (beta-lactamase class C family)
MTSRRHFLATFAGAALGSSRLIASRPLMATCASLAVRRWTAVQKLLDGYVAAKKMAGAIVAVSYGDAAPAYLAAGTIALDSSTRIDEYSVCRIYSMTKPVTGIAAMLLVEDGTITLDQPVAEVLPEFRSLRVAIDIEKSLDSRPATKTMTMRHLLTHTSGLASWTPLSSGPALLHVAYRERGITPGNAGERLNRPGYGPQARSLVEMVERLAALPLAYEPGTIYNYSIGTDVMALVIERASGKKYEAFLHDRLFAPLGMDSTGFQVRPQDAVRLTTNYEVTPNGLAPTDPAASSAFLRPPLLVAGGGGLVSTARDYARFGAALLNDGALEGTRVMKVETARTARSNLLPPGVLKAIGGQGAGVPVVIPGQKAIAPVGSAIGSGAAGTMWWIDPSRRGNVVFLTQIIGIGQAAYTVPAELSAAIEEGLKETV